MNYPTEHTPGPWCWRQLGGIALTTASGGALVVMDFVRDGMHGAAPRMSDRRGAVGGLVHKIGIDDVDFHPDACLIRAAPELLEAAIAAEELLRVAFKLTEGETTTKLRKAIQSAMPSKW